MPLRQVQPEASANGAFADLPVEEQIFFDALIEPSLQTNVAPSQFEIPPLLPEHGVLPATAETHTKKYAKKDNFLIKNLIFFT
ncbi:hypothetical protein ACQ4WQ_23730 [Janthinobacterium sp. GB1R12]|uniref:hypothetical protein n=1 Tax=Janthinobacterium sp. GB1R12 TaxID=3424190 RepID=UPI003F243579